MHFCYLLFFATINFLDKPQVQVWCRSKPPLGIRTVSELEGGAHIKPHCKNGPSFLIPTVLPHLVRDRAESALVWTGQFKGKSKDALQTFSKYKG